MLHRCKHSQRPSPGQLYSPNINLGGLIKLQNKAAAPIDSIQPHPRNVREGDVGAISQSLEAHGQYLPLTVQLSTGNILRGNHTWRAMKALGWEKCAVQYIDVTDEQALRIMLVDNRTADLATYNDNALVELLVELADTQESLDGTGWSGDDLDELIASLNYEDSSMYSNVIEAPTYEPTEPTAPPIDELIDRTRTEALQAALTKAEELPDELRAFLHAAAERHTVFRYDRIAEYYAHAPAEVQRLFEGSLLVIVDFAKAVEEGFVNMHEELVSIFEEDYPDA